MVRNQDMAGALDWSCLISATILFQPFNFWTSNQRAGAIQTNQTGNLMIGPFYFWPSFFQKSNASGIRMSGFQIFTVHSTSFKRITIF
jgi:hypothetical protein